MAGNNANIPWWATIVIHRECRRNLSTQPHRHIIIDGCRDFVNLDEEATPEVALFCATCGCHRHYHRKEQLVVQVDTTAVELIHQMVVEAAANPPLPPLAEGPSPPAPLQGHPVLEENLGDGEVEEGKEDEWRPEWARRRERTRFTPEQKEAMRAYADSLEWSLQGHCEETMCRFCSEIEVSPQVFKVWMKNNKRKYFVSK